MCKMQSINIQPVDCTSHVSSDLMFFEHDCESKCGEIKELASAF